MSSYQDLVYNFLYESSYLKSTYLKRTALLAGKAGEYVLFD